MNHLLTREEIESAASWLLEAAKKAGAFEADVLCNRGTHNVVSFRDGEPEENHLSYTRGVGLRVIDREGRQGVAYVNCLERARLETLVRWSIHNCKEARPDPWVGLNRKISAPGEGEADLGLYDPEVLEISQVERERRCLEMTESARSTDSRVLSVRHAAWDDGWGETLYASSRGQVFWHRGTMASCGLSVVMKDGEEMEMGGESDSSRSLAKLDHLRVSREAVERTGLVLGGKAPRTGKYPLMFTPEVTSDLLGIVGELFLFSNIHKNHSLLKGREGEQIASPLLNLIDDGRIPGGLGSSLFDGEGVPTQRVVLLEKGRVNRFLFDLRHARLHGCSSTGSAVRGVGTLPDVGLSNLFLLPGESGEGELLKKAEGGILVTELLGLHTVDPVTGDFSLGLKGVRIRGGEKAEAVAGATIAGHLLELLERVDALGQDLRFYGSVGGCSLVVQEMATAGR